MKRLTIIWKLIKLSFADFIESNSLRLSASLSFYTLFSIAPILIIIISVVGIFFGTDAVQGRMFNQISQLIGSEATLQIQTIIRNVAISQHSKTSAVIGFIILIIGASEVFTEIQDSINYLWSIKAKPKKGWLKIIINRLLSFSLIGSFGFLLFVTLVINAALDVWSDPLKTILGDTTIYLLYASSTIVILLVTTCMFTIMFKVLPDATLLWKDAFLGAALTAFFTTVGKVLISFYIKYANLGAIFGTAASIIIILLWVYYTSIILFFGASFTTNYATLYGGKIIPKKNAVKIVRQEMR
jgi:membrane protein